MKGFFTTLLSWLGLSSLQFYLTAGLVALVATGSAWGAWEIRAGIAISHEADALAQLQKTHDEAVAKAAATQHAIDLSGYSAGFAFAQSSQAIQAKIYTIVQGIPLYVSPQADADCHVPVGFVRLFDAAVTGTADPSTLPLYPGQSNDAQSDVALSQVVAVLIANFEAYHLTAEQLTALENEVLRQKSIIEGRDSAGP